MPKWDESSRETILVVWYGRSGGAVCFFTNGCDVILVHCRDSIDIKLFYLTGQSLPKKNGAQSPIGTDVTVVDAQ